MSINRIRSKPRALRRDSDNVRIVEPETAEDVAEILRCANEDGAAVIPRGGGTKSDWGNPPARTHIMLSTSRLNRVIEHAWADLTVTVEAGCSIAELQHTLAQHGQRLAVDPGDQCIKEVILVLSRRNGAGRLERLLWHQ